MLRSRAEYIRFSGFSGTLLRLAYMRRRITLNSLASLLINNDENIVMVAKRLGHANIKQTLNTYSHMMPNQEAEMIDKLT